MNLKTKFNIAGRRNVLSIIAILLIFFFSNVSVSYAIDSSNASGIDEDLSYYFIHYSGDQQRVVIDDSVTLTLTGWVDESKLTVNGIIDVHNDVGNQTKNIILTVNNDLNVLQISENQSINYRITGSDTFKADKVQPLELKDEVIVVEKNENGTSIEELKTVDEYGTVINKSLTYYKTAENNKIIIDKEEYDSVNSEATQFTEAVASTEQTNSENTTSAITEEKSALKSIQTTSISSIEKNPSVVYTTHVQSYGWLPNVSDGEMSGTEGQAKRLEAIKISLKNAPYSGDITYKTHVQSYGWLPNVSNGVISGTSGESKRLEAIQINLTGEMEKNYDVYYRVHAQSYGWLGWAKNGEPAGTQGLSKRLEAVKIVLVKKGEAPPSSDKKPFILDPSVVYTTHVQSYGWLPNVSDGELSGTEGQSKRMEAIKISLKIPLTGGITYKTHVQSYGWLDSVSNGVISGNWGK